MLLSLSYLSHFPPGELTHGERLVLLPWVASHGRWAWDSHLLVYQRAALFLCCRPRLAGHHIQQVWILCGDWVQVVVSDLRDKVKT